MPPPRRIDRGNRPLTKWQRARRSGDRAHDLSFAVIDHFRVC